MEAVFERRIKEFATRETIKITLFYSENSKNFLISDNKENPALLSQGRVKFSGRNETSSFPPQQREFVSESVGGGGEIRTHDTLTGIAVFKTARFNRSRTPPGNKTF